MNSMTFSPTLPHAKEDQQPTEINMSVTILFLLACGIILTLGMVVGVFNSSLLKLFF